jgi:hypothetical protein
MSMFVKVVNMMPHSLSGEDNMDSEPSIAVNPANPMQIAASAFTPDPMHSGRGPIYVSTDGGDTWKLNVILPGGNVTNDITLRFAAQSNILYAGILRDATLDLNILRKINFTAPGVMALLLNKTADDQPYIEATTDASTDRVFTGENDFHATPKSATVDVSLNPVPPAPAHFVAAHVEPRATLGQDGPSVRPAIHHSGTVYAAYFGWRSSGIGVNNSDVVVVRDDNWATGPARFQNLIDPGDAKAGLRIAKSVPIPFLGTLLGHQRIGSQLSLAVDPRDKKVVYIAWCDGSSAANYTIHVRRSIDSGGTWSVDLRSVVKATNPQLAINALGDVGFLYQKLHDPGSGNRWQTHIEISRADDAFSTFEDIVLADIPDDNGTGPTMNPTNPLGDYAGLIAVGEMFYGVFCGNNTPDLANFPHGVTYQRNHDFATHQLFNLGGIPVIPSYDPFFFKVGRRHEERKCEGEGRGLDYSRIEVEGLKYEKLEIKRLRLDLVDPRREHGHHGRHEHHDGEEHAKKKHLGAIRRLGEEMEELGHRLVSVSDEDRDDEC